MSIWGTKSIDVKWIPVDGYFMWVTIDYFMIAIILHSYREDLVFINLAAQPRYGLEKDLWKSFNRMLSKLHQSIWYKLIDVGVVRAKGAWSGISIKTLPNIKLDYTSHAFVQPKINIRMFRCTLVNRAHLPERLVCGPAVYFIDRYPVNGKIVGLDGLKLNQVCGRLWNSRLASSNIE